MNKCLAVIIGSLLLSGCTSQWVRTSSSAEDYVTARASCENKSEQAYPVRNEVAQRTRYATYTKYCSKKSNCDGKRTRIVERPEIESYIIDVNSDSRDQLFYSCMERKGWISQINWF